MRERRNEFDKAFSWLEHGLKHVDPKNPMNEAARIYLLGAGIYYRQGKYSESIAWCEKSNSIAALQHSRESQYTMARVNALLGATHNRLGDLGNAIEFCNNSIQTFEMIGEYVGLAGAYNNLGINYKDQGNWEMSSQAYNKSLELNTQIGDIQQAGLVANNIAEIYLYRGEWDRAA